jgi:ubiquinone/menaquinone biosynthesis C-methylase UbiE
MKPGQKEVFDRIAPSWYNFRHHSIFTKELEELARRWGKGRLLNIGCGHGADFLSFREGFELHGIDFSPEMLKMAEKYAAKYGFNVNLKEAEATALPYQDSYFDWAIAIASFHHLVTRKERLKAFAELRRILKPGGEAFVTVWNHGQPRFWFKPKDVMIPWRQKQETLERYYHLFSYGELEGLARETRLKTLKSFPESFYRLPVKFWSRNICLLLQKPA